VTTPHKATPEQWRNIEKLASSCIYDLVILELRDRIAALEETENDQRFRDCMAAIDKHRQDDLRDAPEMVATDAELIKAWDAGGDVAYLSRMRRVYNLGREHGAADATCPHIVTSDEGTSYCDLAEQTANSSAGLTGSNHPAKPDSSPAPAGELVELAQKAISDIEFPHGNDEARAAIMAIASYMEGRNWFPAACWLREEIARHG
jgi:hypothetical protein